MIQYVFTLGTPVILNLFIFLFTPPFLLLTHTGECLEKDTFYNAHEIHAIHQEKKASLRHLVSLTWPWHFINYQISLLSKKRETICTRASQFSLVLGLISGQGLGDYVCFCNSVHLLALVT